MTKKKNEFRGGFFCRHRSKMFFPPTLNTEDSDRSPRACHVTSTLKRIKQTNVNTLRIPTANQTRDATFATHGLNEQHATARCMRQAVFHRPVSSPSTPLNPFAIYVLKTRRNEGGKHGGECAPALDTRARKSGICKNLPPSVLANRPHVTSWTHSHD